MAVPQFPRLLEQLFISPARPPRQVERLAETRVRALVAHAGRHIPLYRELYAGGTGPFRGRADLCRLPLVDKDMLVSAGDAARDPRVPPGQLDEMRTSGTSGRSIRLVRTRAELRVTRRAVLRHFLRIGMRPWHRVLTLGSGWLKTRRGLFVTRIVKTRHLEAHATLDEQIAALDEFRPVALIGQTGGIYLLARELLRRNRPYPLKNVVPTGATLSPTMRAVIAAAFGAQPCDMYGAIEVGPIAWQCRRGGYHIDADRLIVEIVDARGQPVAPGTPGQVVVTNLYAWTMPFIRYRLQDLTALALRQCSCGCRFPLLMPVQGRINDFLPTPAGDLVSPHFFFHIFDDVASPVKDWRIIQERTDHLVYEFVPEERFDAAALERGLARVRARFGPTCLLETRAVDHVPFTATGKRRCIISRLRPGDVALDQAWVSALGASASQAEAAV
jgi:phenylacetate-CoA ligase